MKQQPKQATAFISFRCVSCEQEIEVQSDMAGAASECPACGNSIRVPETSEDGTLWSRSAAGRQTDDAEQTAMMKGRTIRIELSDDF